MPDLTLVSAVGFAAFGAVLGMLLEERLWWLLHRPLPRPWRPVWRACRAVRAYLAVGALPGDVRRCWTTGRWT